MRPGLYGILVVEADACLPSSHPLCAGKQRVVRTTIAVFPILADAVDVKRVDQLCETVSQPKTQPDKVARPMGS